MGEKRVRGDQWQAMRRPGVLHLQDWAGVRIGAQGDLRDWQAMGISGRGPGAQVNS